MKKALVLPIFALLNLVALTGCDKDSAPDPAQTQTCYLNKVKGLLPDDTWLLKEEILTDASHRIVRANTYTGFSAGMIEEYTLFLYDTAGQLVKTEEFKGNNVPTRYFTFEYNAQQQLFKQTEFWYDESTGTFNEQYSWLMEYNAADQLIKRINTTPGSNNYTTYEYNGAGNVIRTAHYYAAQPGSTPVLNGGTEYEFDDKRPFHGGFNIAKFDASSLSKNNITKVVVKDENGNVNQYESLNYTYLYNSHGYPTQMTAATILDPSESGTLRFEYNCL